MSLRFRRSPDDPHSRGGVLVPLLLLAAAVIPPANAADAWWEKVDPSLLPPADKSIHEVIDHFIDARLAKWELKPAAPAPRGIRYRRLLLDLHGRVPTVAELDAFHGTADHAEGWAGEVDRLIASPAFDRHLAHELNWLLMDGQATEFQKYLERATASRAGWDTIFRDTVTGLADAERPGVDQFLRQRVTDNDRMANDVSVRFFGVNVSCAQCHDHPYVKDWTQETYYGMRAFFSRTFDNGGFFGEREYGMLTYKTTSNEERVAGLRFLGGAPLAEPAAVEPGDEEKKAERARLEEFKKNKQAPPSASYSRRARLIEAGLAPGEEQWFARSMVNRTWHRFFGHGLVMPLDQMHGKNEPSHPELMAWLARDFAAHGYDLRRLVRGIALSRAWQRDSVWESGDRPPLELFAVAHPRPLSPRQYAVSLKVAASAPESFVPGAGGAAEVEKRLEGVERGAAGIERWFERPGDDFQIAVDEALFLSNSREIEEQILAGGGLVRSLTALPGTEERLRLVGRAVWQRELSGEEIEVFSEFLGTRGDRPEEGLRQLVWAMLTSSEMRFNH